MAKVMILYLYDYKYYLKGKIITLSPNHIPNISLTLILLQILLLVSLNRVELNKARARKVNS